MEDNLVNFANFYVIFFEMIVWKYYVLSKLLQEQNWSWFISKLYFSLGFSVIYCPEMQGFRVDFLSLVRLKNGPDKVQSRYEFWFNLIKFIYSEKATKFCEIFTWLLTVYCGQKLGEDFAKFCGLPRIYELS